MHTCLALSSFLSINSFSGSTFLFWSSPSPIKLKILYKCTPSSVPKKNSSSFVGLCLRHNILFLCTKYLIKLFSLSSLSSGYNTFICFKFSFFANSIN